MKLTIVTPEQVAFDDEVTQVTLPTVQGEITVLPHHLPIITQILPGELVIGLTTGKREYFATGGGFAEITGQSISVLVDLAKHEREINEKAVLEAQERAREALAKREELSEEEIALTEASLLHSLAQLKVKRRRHSNLPTTPTTS